MSATVQITVPKGAFLTVGAFEYLEHRTKYGPAPGPVVVTLTVEDAYAVALLPYGLEASGPDLCATIFSPQGEMVEQWVVCNGEWRRNV